MQKIHFVVVGKIKESFYTEAVGEYVKRLSRFAKVEIKELPEGANPEAEADYICLICLGKCVTAFPFCPLFAISKNMATVPR